MIVGLDTDVVAKLLVFFAGSVPHPRRRRVVVVLTRARQSQGKAQCRARSSGPYGVHMLESVVWERLANVAPALQSAQIARRR
jgi:hypothetical protein